MTADITDVWLFRTRVFSNGSLSRYVKKVPCLCNGTGLMQWLQFWISFMDVCKDLLWYLLNEDFETEQCLVTLIKCIIKYK